MPYFIVFAKDKKESGAAIRAANRSAHLEWTKTFGDKLKVGGPLMSDDQQAMIGSLLIIEYESLDALKAYLKSDPYAQAGLFQSVDVRPYTWLLGTTKPV